MATDPSAEDVARLLADPDTRITTLDALEKHSGAHDPALAAAAAPALSDLLALDAMDVPHAVFQRVGLLRARLLHETPADDRAALYGAMFGGGRFVAEWDARNNVIAMAVRHGAAALTREDALSYGCAWAHNNLTHVRNYTESVRAAGLGGTIEWFGQYMTYEPLASK